MSGKQVAVLVAYHSAGAAELRHLRQRLATLPVRWRCCRASARARGQDQVIARLTRGGSGYRHGTHRLISQDVFSRFGLLIIDEEKRFGVTHKSILKAATEVDVLTLTATPIRAR